MKYLLKTLLLGVTVSIALSACLHGKNDGLPVAASDNPFAAPGAKINVYLPINDASGLVAIDPENPANRFLLAPKNEYQSVFNIVSGNFLETTIDKAYVRSVIFVRDGKIYKANLIKDGNPLVQQISNEDSLTLVCGQDASPDFVNHENSAFVYEVPGADGECGTQDDSWKMVRTGMTPDESPLSAQTPYTPLYDDAGQRIGWLSAGDGSLVRYSSDFDRSSVVQMFSNSARRYYVGNSVFLNLDGTLYHLNKRTNALSAIAVFENDVRLLPLSASDKNFAYFAAVHLRDRSVTFYKTSIDGGGSVIEIGRDYGHPTALSVSDNYVIYTLLNEFGGELKALGKSGGLPIALATGATTNAYINYVQGTKLYYGRVTTEGGVETVNAGVMNEDGSNPVETANSIWISPYNSFSSKQYAENTILQYNGYYSKNKINGYGFAGTGLKSFNTRTGELIAEIGTIPTANFRGFTVFGPNPEWVAAIATNKEQSDWFLLSMTKPNSLQRLTDYIQ